MIELDDEALVRAARAGDEVALAALLGRHRARMKAVAVSILGHSPDTEDVVQDACLTAVLRLDDLRDPAAAGSWLAAIVANSCRGRLRRPSREVSTAELATLPAAFDPVEQAVDRAASRAWVWTALRGLSEPLRLTVVIRYFTDLNSYAQIAELCQVPIGTIRSRLSAARAQLAEELLATASQAWPSYAVAEQRAAEAAHTMREFERTGDGRQLAGLYRPDLTFMLADRVPRRGLGQFAALLAADFDDGVTTRTIRITSGPGLAVVELLLDSPADYPQHCPPAMTMVHLHDGSRTHRILSHYAA